MSGQIDNNEAGTGKGRRSLARRLGWGHGGCRVRRRWLGLLALVLVLLLPCLANLRDALRHGMDQRYVDLGIWHRTVQNYNQAPTAPLYETNPSYLYPPFFLTLISPLFKLPPEYATATFQLLKWVALIVSLWLAWRLCSPHGEDIPVIVAIGSIVLTARFLDNELANGNVNMFMLVAVLAAAWLAARGWLVAAGFVAMAAACVKITPALLLVYFVYKRWWRTLWGAAIAAVVCMIVWPAIFMGWENNLHQLAGWYRHLPAAYLSEGRVYSVHSNQALAPLLNRLFGHYKAFEEPGQPDIYVALAVLPKWALNTLRVALTLPLVGILAYTCRRRIDPRRQRVAFAAEVALVQIAMLALSGISWKAHYVAMLLPNTVLLTYLADRRYADRGRKWVKRCVLASFVLCTLTCDLIGPTASDYVEAYGLILFGALAAWAGLVILRPAVESFEQSPVIEPEAVAPRTPSAEVQPS